MSSVSEEWHDGRRNFSTFTSLFHLLENNNADQYKAIKYNEHVNHAYPSSSYGTAQCRNKYVLFLRPLLLKLSFDFLVLNTLWSNIVVGDLAHL